MLKMKDMVIVLFLNFLAYSVADDKFYEGCQFGILMFDVTSRVSYKVMTSSFAFVFTKSEECSELGSRHSSSVRRYSDGAGRK
jgi:hypothetical protein